MHSHKLQRKFFDFVRSGEVDNFPEVQPTFYLYHKQMKKKLSNLLTNSFPLTQEVLGDEKWNEAIVKFLIDHAPPAEELLSLCHAFYRFLLENIAGHQSIARHMKDVIVFEYTLMELFYMENLPHAPFVANGNRLESPIVLNPEHRFLRLDFPIFQNISSASYKNPCFLFMYRHATTFSVEFIEISPLYFNVLQQIAEKPVSILTAIEKAAAYFSLLMDEIDIHETVDFVAELQNHGAIFGFASQ